MEKKNMENQEKIEENYKKFLKKQKQIECLEKDKDLKRMQAEKEIDEKREKIEQFKKEQELILERKRQVRDDIIRKKEEYDYKFQKMFHRKNIDDRMIRNIQNMFPGNERINSLLNRLQELEEEEQNEMLKAEIKGKEIDDNLKKSQNEFKQTFSSSNRTTRSNYRSSKPNDNNLNKIKVVNENENEDKIIETDENNNDNNNIKIIGNESKMKNSNNNNNNYFTFGIKKEEKKKKAFSNDKKKNKRPQTVNNALPISENNNFNSSKKNYNQTGNFNTNNTNYNTSLSNYNQTFKTVPSNRSKTNSNNIRSNNYNNDFQDDKKIEKKLNEYKVELSNQLLQFITEEKKKEAERIDYYNNSTDPTERANLMKKLGEERTKSAMLILQMNEDMAQKYKDYEKSLRKY